MTIPKLAIAAVISSVAPTAIQPDPSAPSVYGLSLTIINQTLMYIRYMRIAAAVVLLLGLF